MNDKITTETDGESYADIRINGNEAASVDVTEKDGKEIVKIKPINPNNPEYAIETHTIELENQRLSECTACGHSLNPENYNEGDYIVCPMCRSGYYK